MRSMVYDLHEFSVRKKRSIIVNTQGSARGNTNDLSSGFFLVTKMNN